jgi:hypothetical protein
VALFLHTHCISENRALLRCGITPSSLTVMFINDLVSPLTRSWNHSPLPQTYFGADRKLQAQVRVAGAEILFRSFFSSRVISVHWTGYRPQPPSNFPWAHLLNRIDLDWRNRLRTFPQSEGGHLVQCQNIQNAELNEGKRNWNQSEKWICSLKWITDTCLSACSSTPSRTSTVVS